MFCFYDICQDLCQECSLPAALIEVSGRSHFKETINTVLENSYFETIRRKTFCLVPPIKCQKWRRSCKEVTLRDSTSKSTKSDWIKLTVARAATYRTIVVLVHIDAVQPPNWKLKANYQNLPQHTHTHTHTHACVLRVYLLHKNRNNSIGTVTTAWGIGNWQIVIRFPGGVKRFCL
jgi:hypothetical protein